MAALLAELFIRARRRQAALLGPICSAIWVPSPRCNWTASQMIDTANRIVNVNTAFFTKMFKLWFKFKSMRRDRLAVLREYSL